MEILLKDIWPALLGALLTAVGLYAGYIRKLQVEVAELKKDVTNQQKVIDNMSKRLDSHSKKQDEIYKTLTDFRLEMLKQMGTMTTDMSKQMNELSQCVSALSVHVENLNKLISISDAEFRFK